MAKKEYVETYRGSAGLEGTGGQLERVGTSRVPEGDLLAREVDLVGNVMPDTGLPESLPLALAADHPLQVGVLVALLAVDPSVLHLGEVGLEEVDLMLMEDARGVLVAAHHGEVVEDLALVDRGLGLRNQLRPPHVAVPLGRRVDGDLRALLRAGIDRVLEGGSEIDIGGDGAAAVDVVLVGADLIRP